MPVTVGSRLDQLIALRKRIDVEIELERREELRRGRVAERRARVDGRAAGSRKHAATQADRFRQLGVTSLIVKRWAYDVGLIAEVTRGRCQSHLIDAYEEAHPTTKGLTA